MEDISTVAKLGISLIALTMLVTITMTMLNLAQSVVNEGQTAVKDSVESVEKEEEPEVEVKPAIDLTPVFEGIKNLAAKIYTHFQRPVYQIACWVLVAVLVLKKLFRQNDYVDEEETVQ